MPDCIEAMVGKARLLMTLDQLESAETELNNAISVDENCYRAWMTFGELHELQHDVPEAIKAYKKAAKVDKKQPAPHERLQAIYEKIGFEDLAEDEQEIAERLRKALYRQANKKKKK